MKMIRNISGYAKVLAGAFLAALLEVSCTQVEVDVPYVKPGDEHAVKVTFTLGHSEALLDEENQDTKSYLTRAGIDTYISGVTLAIYDSGGTQAYLGYVTSGFNAVDIMLMNNKTYNIYAVANLGDQRTALSSAIEGGTLSSLTYTVDYSTMNTNGIPMAASVTGQSFSSASSLTVYLQRLLAKINVSLSCDWSEAVITRATVKNVNPKVAPFGEFPASSFNHAILQDIHGTTPGTGNTMSAVFYVPENNKGTVGSVANSLQKSYNNNALSSIRDYATYLEVYVTPGGEYEGNAIYRSYLGANETTDFNIQRNEVYDWELTYSKSNLANYQNWKRNTDGLFYYRLECTTANPSMNINSAHITPGSATSLTYVVRKYSFATNTLVATYNPSSMTAAYPYNSVDGNDASSKITCSVATSNTIYVYPGDRIAGPVYIEAVGTYNGHTLHSARTLFHANGYMGVEFVNPVYDVNLQQIYSSTQDAEFGMPYRVRTYYNGSYGTSNNDYGLVYGYLNESLPTGFNLVYTGWTDGNTWDDNSGDYLNFVYQSSVSPGCYMYMYVSNSYSGVISWPVVREFTMVWRYKYSSYNPSSGYGQDGYTTTCTLNIRPPYYHAYTITPNTVNVNVGSSCAFTYTRSYYANGVLQSADDITLDSYTTWSIESATLGMTGLSMGTGIQRNTLLVGADATPGNVVVIKARHSSGGDGSIAYATVTVSGGGTGGGIDDDWEGGGEQVLD